MINYTCSYCFREFTPKRRRVQKYCSNTCRSKAYHERKSNTETTVSKTATDLNVSQSNEVNSLKNQSKIEAMSAAGIGNAAAGHLLADGLKSIFTSNLNKPATKADINKLITMLNKRYLPIKNMPMNANKQYPFYDIVTNSVVYLSNSL